MTDYTILTFVYLCQDGMSHLKIFYGWSNKQLVFIMGHIFDQLN